MPHKGPHISIAPDYVVNRILRINLEEFAEWPEAVRRLAIEIAEELFLVAYNPFIDAATAKTSVKERFDRESFALAHHYATSIGEGITMFWSAHEAETAFRTDLIHKLREIMPEECIISRPAVLVECATDATDLRMELPLLVVEPENAIQVSELVRLANEMKFALIPRGGASGYTGGSVPARKRSVVVAMTRCNAVGPIDTEAGTMTAGAGVITQHAIDFADEHGFLFTVDPASKTAASIGGNVAENSGGPYAFEYGTTLDNLLSWRMVTPTGEIITIERVDHPRHKILPHETAVFEIKDQSGGVRNVVELKGDEIRLPGLGKDVTNKALGGLPGVQKEGVDGIVIDATFVIHKKPALSQVVVLEFFGRSMHGATVVITEIIDLRDRIREQGDYAHISALEEFNAKYVQAIEYQRKSQRHTEDPISVLLLRFDADEPWQLERCTEELKAIVARRDDVEIIIAGDDKEAELFWEDRHRLSAIAKRTSGFKINEYVVIPMNAIPEFALYLEALNLEYMARAYRDALREAATLPGVPEEDCRITDELAWAGRIIKGEIPSSDLSDQELQMKGLLFFRAFAEEYPRLAPKAQAIQKRFVDTAICVASHMHAGDGNWHVNIPVNSNDPDMLANAERVAHLVMDKAQEVGGEVTGEHGIGITKIRFLTWDKMRAFREFKQSVDPRNIFNPAKLTQKELPVSSFTFSFNRLIQDIKQSGLVDKERLISLLSNIQVCTRCGKCRQFCPMYYPEQGMLFHPRNKNLSLGALIEAIYYSQVNHGKPDPSLLAELRSMVEHCTGCGKCMAVCPVKIASAEVALTLRGYLEDEGAGGHPIKSRVLRFVAEDPARRVPRAAKLASIGQGTQNRLLPLAPRSWRSRLANPLFSGPGPRPGYRNLKETLELDKGSFFVPEGDLRGVVFYFPGCGGSVFYRGIGLAGLTMALSSGYAVMLPEQHLCCGYPLLAAGEHEAFAVNQDRNVTHLRALARKAAELGYPVTHMLTSCGSCRDGMERHFIPQVFPRHEASMVQLADMADFLLSVLPPLQRNGHGFDRLLYHTPCHAESPGVHKAKAATIYAAKFAGHTGSKVFVSPGCCGESGLGAMTSPAIYNRLRARKAARLETDFAKVDARAPVLVSCPSCKMGIMRILMQQGDKRRVLHVLEYLAELLAGERWRRKFAKLLRSSVIEKDLRRVNIAALAGVQLTEAEARDGDDEDTR